MKIYLVTAMSGDSNPFWSSDPEGAKAIARKSDSDRFRGPLTATEMSFDAYRNRLAEKRTLKRNLLVPIQIQPKNHKP